MIEVAYHLRRKPADHPATALLLVGDDAPAVLPLCARLGVDPAGHIFAVAGGMVVILDEPTRGTFPGAIRLRNLARGLLLPVDAELIPSLLDDEAQGLSRDRGIVFLPGGQGPGIRPARADRRLDAPGRRDPPPP